MKKLQIKVKRPAKSVDTLDKDKEIDNLLDTAQGLVDDLMTTANRISDVVEQTRAVTRQYAATLHPDDTNGDS